ncbi:MAG: AAA family ATPase [Acidimicrobiia bacterium]
MSESSERSRSDLIQLEYALYSDMLRERLAKNQEDPDLVACELLEVESSKGLTSFDESVPVTDMEAVLIVLAELVGAVDDKRVRGANPTRPPTWETLDLGAESVRVPRRISVHFLAGEAADVPIWFRSWTESGGYSQYLHVYARAADAGEAERFLPSIVDAARSSRSPYRNRVVEATMGQGGLQLRIVPTPAETRGSLVFEDGVWSAVTRNIDRMFERMSVLKAAGLGGNRGLLLAGPPGTGKTALCRALAAEHEGRSTVVIVSAAVGSYMLGSLYERLDRLAPALVLVEDLDLIVGDREHGAGPGLIQFLTVLDGLMTRHSGVVTVATTNDPKAIDAAATRAARFDQVVFLGLPSLEARRAILDLYLSKVDHNADVGEISRISEGLSGADLREVVRSSVLDADAQVVAHEDMIQATERLLAAK